MWIYVSQKSKVRCASCAALIDFGALEMYINPDYLTSNRLRLTCDCGAAFSMADLLSAGASVVNHVQLCRPPAREQVEVG